MYNFTLYTDIHFTNQVFPNIYGKGGMPLNAASTYTRLTATVKLFMATRFVLWWAQKDQGCQLRNTCAECQTIHRTLVEKTSSRGFLGTEVEVVVCDCEEGEFSIANAPTQIHPPARGGDERKRETETYPEGW